MCMCVRFFQAVKALTLPALNKIICVQTSIPMYVCMHIQMYINLQQLFVVALRARQPTTIVLQIQIQKLQNVPLWDYLPMVHGGWDTVYPIYGNQNAMQRKCTINKGSPSPSPDGAVVKLNCFGCRYFCCCCYIPALLQYHTKELAALLNRTKSSNILLCLLHLITAGMRVTAARDKPFKKQQLLSNMEKGFKINILYLLALKTSFKLKSFANIDIDNNNSFPIRKLQFWYFLALLICKFELLTPILISIKRRTALSMR